MGLDERTMEGLAQELGDDLPEFIAIFLAESPRLWQEAIEGAAAGDVGRVRHALHTLRTSTALVGMRAEAETMHAIEKLADAAALDLVRAKLAALDARLREGWAQLERYRR